MADGQTEKSSGRKAAGSRTVTDSRGLSAAVKQHLQIYFRAHDGSLPAEGLYDRVLREVERPLIELSLAATRGNQVRAARLLGVNRNTLRKKIQKLRIPVKRGMK